ncbi:MAG TPA: aminopeptidase [Anaerolineales bacterium]|nr:aminopeptidase [Anaerolineales bacterium]
MGDPRTVNLAQILVNYSIDVQKNDWVLIWSSIQALDLALEVQRYVLRAGGNPTMMFEDEAEQEVLFREGSDAQIQWVSPLTKQLIKEVDALIRLKATTNTRALNGVDPKKQKLYQQARQEFMQTYMQRAATGDLRWVLTQYPCPAYAQEADMSLKEFEDFVYAAVFADQPDPIAHWRAIHDEQQRLIDWLKGKKHVHARGPNSDLQLSIADRVWINSDGHKNMPSGEIYTGPVEDSANGWVRFTYPAISNGRSVEGVALTFKDGKVVDASAEKNEAFLLEMLDSDPGARYLGEFAIGTNYGIQRFTKSILYDEKIGGSMHMAVGAGYPETGSKNVSSIHWDFICDMRDDSEILVDGELFYKNGKFMV